MQKMFGVVRVTGTHGQLVMGIVPFGRIDNTAMEKSSAIAGMADSC